MNTQTSRRSASRHASDKEMFLAGFLWVAFAALCVFAANTMATAL